jgi:putative transposase
VAFLVDDGQQTPQRHATVSVDRGVTVAAVISDGTFHDRRFITGGEKVRYRRLQQTLARQHTGSANRRRTVVAMSRIMADRPGRNVRGEAGLNRAILDNGWYKLELALRSSARHTGSRIVLVNPAYTSQTCNRCGHVDPTSRTS